MSQSRMTAVCEKGILTFDGEVVEVFGFGRNDYSVGVHVAMLEKMKVNEGGRLSDPAVSFKARNMNKEGMAIFTDEEAASPEVTGLIDAVRKAAPNVEAS
jgi:hypothetical protein